MAMAPSSSKPAKTPPPHILLIPYPAQGHVNPFLRLAKALHARGLHVTFVHTEHNHGRLLRSRGPGAVAAPADGFRFETIPDGLPRSEHDATQDIWALCEATRRACPGHVRELVQRLGRTEGVPPVTCVVADGAMGFAVHAAKGMGLPAYLFFTPSACGFLCYLNFDQLVKRGYVPFKAGARASIPSTLSAMSQSTSPPGKKGPRKDRAAWTNGRLAFLVSMMKEYSDVGKYRGQNGWTKEGWHSMKNRLNARTPGANFTVQQLKDREQRLKKELNVVKSIVEKSGFGWDPKNKVPTALDEKWEELSSEQRKWRHKPFPYYDILYEIHEGKMAEGKHCKRTTDGTEERYKNMSHLPEHGSYTDDVMRAASMESPEATLSAPGSVLPEYDWDGDMYGDDVNLSYDGYSEPPGGNENHVSAVEDLTSVDSPRRKRLRNSKGADDGSEKTKGKRGKDIALANLVSVREEEMQTYKEMKTKQIESYKEIKMAQMERNDPKNDPYGMPNCIQKLKTLGLTPSEQHKMIKHLKEDMLNRQTFMEVDDDVLSVIIQEVVAPHV